MAVVSIFLQIRLVILVHNSAEVGLAASSPYNCIKIFIFFPDTSRAEDWTSLCPSRIPCVFHSSIFRVPLESFPCPLEFFPCSARIFSVFRSNLFRVPLESFPCSARIPCVFCSIMVFFPRSLRVSLDMGKVVYSWMISRDSEMPGTTVRSSTIPEELGRVAYLLTDKTGTLTQNEWYVVVDIIYTPFSNSFTFCSHSLT